MFYNFDFVGEVVWVVNDDFGFGFKFYFGFDVGYGGFDVDCFVVFVDYFVDVGVEYVGVVVDGW